MPFCPQCGVDNPASARFCDQCGAALIPVPAQPATSTTAPPASASAPTVTAATVSSPTVGPTICPQCGAAAIPGEAFCDNCGAPLNAPARPATSVPTPPYSSGLPPQPAYPPPQSTSGTTAAPPLSYSSSPPMTSSPQTPPPTLPPTPPPVAPARTTLAPAQLVVLKTGTAIPLPATGQAIVGRADPVSKFAPDVDLTAYEALEQGVGRRHVRLYVQAGQLMIEDLDSTNGTLVNGQKLLARQPLALRGGEQVQLGRLILQIQP